MRKPHSSWHQVKCLQGSGLLSWPMHSAELGAGPRWHRGYSPGTALTHLLCHRGCAGTRMCCCLCVRAELSAHQGPPGAAECQAASDSVPPGKMAESEGMILGKESPAASATSSHLTGIFTDGLQGAQTRASPSSSV